MKAIEVGVVYRRRRGGLCLSISRKRAVVIRRGATRIVAISPGTVTRCSHLSIKALARAWGADIPTIDALVRDRWFRSRADGRKIVNPLSKHAADVRDARAEDRLTYRLGLQM